ncbi:SAM-dependent methyltransferase [Actinomadura sp. NPDC048394]|uniref:SAM-dependent methyltransferase n=1 Tax=Actinomadura sp. NPDC048394 TaxID=3158223 RepID=UPI00340BB343
MTGDDVHGTDFGAGPVRVIDTAVPNSARVWDYWLGGKDNYLVDRDAGDAYVNGFPEIIDLARAQRLFLQRAVGYLATEGLDQFLDVGAGLPAVDNTHEVAQRVVPDARIVYVDNDPLVLANARALLVPLGFRGVTSVIGADVLNPDAIVEEARETLDFSRPVAVLMLGILGHVPGGAQARDIVHRLVAHLVPGSHLVVCDGINASPAHEAAQDAYNRTGAAPYQLRTPAEISGFLDGLDLVDPGVVAPDRWRPEHPDLCGSAAVEARAGVGRVA